MAAPNDPPPPAAERRAWIGLGANLGDRRQTIRRALESLGDLPDVQVEAVSKLIETEPVGGPPGQPAYLNGVARVRTAMAPEALLDVLQRIESDLGRDRAREQRWGPRPIDLDLLLFGDAVCTSPRLTLPHPRLAERRFVLAPLAELDPDLVVPGTSRSVRALLDALRAGPTMPAGTTAAEGSGDMRIVETRQTMRALRDELRAAGGVVGFVPTMGALHAGHLSLVERARTECDHVVSSVFVNPLQFGPGEDLERYPRDREGDARQLAAAGADACFFARADDMYGPEHATYVVQEGPALGLEGEARPGHFRGVLTVVLKLLLLARPDRAYFGRKDYQQSVVIRRMVRDLDLETEVCVCPTVRDADGLALSSRNAYLSAQERASALAIPRALEAAAGLHAHGERSANALEAAMADILGGASGLQVEYAVCRHPDTLGPPLPDAEHAVLLIAARVGATRLIDNQVL